MRTAFVEVDLPITASRPHPRCARFRFVILLMADGVGLDGDSLSAPDVLNLENHDAMGLVAELLERLLDSHEELKAKLNDSRRSFDQAMSSAKGFEQKLRVASPPVLSDLSDEEAVHKLQEAIPDDEPQHLYRRFWLKNIPRLSPREYLARFHRYCTSSTATYLTAGKLVYSVAIEKQMMPVTRHNVYRLFAAAFLIAAKFIEDLLYPMSRYATTAGVSKSELARLEVALLLLVDFDIKTDLETMRENLTSWANL